MSYQDVAPLRIKPTQDPDLDSWTDTWLMAALIIGVGMLVFILGS